MSSIPNNPNPPVQPPMAGPGAVHALGSAVTEEAPKKKRRHKPVVRTSALNITSMMDLVLNLLLFFVLTSNFALTEGILPATLPTGGGGEGSSAAIVENTTKPPENPIIIQLREIGQNQTVIQIEGSNASPRDYEELYSQLNSWRNDSANPNGIYKDDNPITIRPDKTVSWKQVVEAFNAVIRAKYKDVGFAPPQS